MRDIIFFGDGTLHAKRTTMLRVLVSTLENVDAVKT